jgi:hypothetical protein
MKTLTISAAPLNASTPTESAKLVERPNAIMHTPNTATAVSSVRPVRCIGGKFARANDVITAPIAGAARNKPSP